MTLSFSSPQARGVPSGAQVRPVEVDAAGLRLSGLLALPPGPPRAVIVALHGAGMRAGYFHGTADPAASLLSLAASRGHAALALDRPGYGLSAATVPDGLELAEQANHVRQALTGYHGRHPIGAGFVIVGHSLGGKVALAVAAGWSGEAALLGVDVSGISDRWAVDRDLRGEVNGRRTRSLSWGPLRLYPPRTFQHAMRLAAPVPPREAAEIPEWPRRYPEVAREVRVPVRFTFAEHERWWRCDPATVEAMTARLAAPFVRTEHLAGAGHNISLGYAARDYHLGVLAFADECLARSNSDTT
ncbi:alpha/beta hydrolase [Spongiactinospora gelatinilytica]|uniref:Alpha/beta hydrolase n=1 Tax=Spongiactinospora gelatinilytica TaxID=2666298 RepID=A0A2W2H2V2_9ACTN|nr:alpha/beta hydrolase [Spongiactinospora gelatinilytica]PZG56396.1 alpha/beta hydrolase [Spongiactinospora gelatinilytica]